ncbi:MAG: hypothetical protein HC850_11280, partial [Rhodomicrobium sp.]|nr:hypothetical protein [Rhodomicrobium sp.]
HRVRADTDSTYGTIFSFWDRWFGTTTPTERRPLMPLGVEGKEELTLVALLGRPTQRTEDRNQRTEGSGGDRLI